MLLPLQRSPAGKLLRALTTNGLMGECCCPSYGGWIGDGWIDTGETKTQTATATFASSVMQVDTYGGVGGHGHCCVIQYSDSVVTVDVQVWPETIAPGEGSTNCSISGGIGCGGKQVDFGRRGGTSNDVDSTDLGSTANNEDHDQTLLCTLTVTYPMRLMAYYSHRLRSAAGGYEWGKLDTQEEKRDLREYDQMRFGWHWFPADGVATAHLNLTWSGGNTVVQFTSAGACNITPAGPNGIHGTTRTSPVLVQSCNLYFATGGAAPCSQSITGIRTFGLSPNLKPDTNTSHITNPPTGGQNWTYTVAADSVTVSSALVSGEDPWNFPVHGAISLSNLCPPYEFDVIVEAQNVGGVNMTAAPTPAPYDGPDPDDTGENEVMTAVDGTPISFELNDDDALEWTDSARAYTIAVGNLNNPNDSWSWPVQEAVQEYGTFPALGFAYEPTALQNAGWDKAAWRLCMRVPTPNAMWDAMQFGYGTSVSLPLLDSKNVDVVHWWTAGAGTTVAQSVTDFGCLQISGPGALSLTRDITGNDIFLDSGRYLTFKLKSSDAGETVDVTFSAGSSTKTWSFVTGAANEYAERTIDLMQPLGATGTANDSTRWERLFSGGAGGLSQGDWAYGVDTPVELKMEFSGGDITIESISLGSTSRIIGALIVAESMPEDVPEFRLNDRELWSSITAEQYAYRILAFLPEWRLACDEMQGLIMRYEHNGQDWRIYRAYAVQNLIDNARLLGRSDATKSLVTVTNLRPVPSQLHMTTIEDDVNGSFSYWQTAHWFHNAVRAYNLWPARYDCAGTIDVAVAVQVDRIFFEPGTTRYSNDAVRAITARKIWGGGWSGIAPGSTAVRLTSQAESVETQTVLENGYYLPKTVDDGISYGTNYRIEDASNSSDGIAVDAPIQGVLWRASWP